MAKNQTLADLIRVIKFKSSITQSDIAAKIGVSKQYLSDTINGRYPFSDDLKQKLYEQFTYLQDEDDNTSGPKEIPPPEVSDGDVQRLIRVVESQQEALRVQQHMTQQLIDMMQRQQERGAGFGAEEARRAGA